VQVDGVPIGDGRTGPVTRKLSDALLAAVDQSKEAASAVSR
jgi:hypothetical protein